MLITINELYRAVQEFSMEDAERHYPELIKTCESAGIRSKESLAHFIAQCAHESGGFKWVREIWGPTKQQLRYDTHPGLGNKYPGDGKRYMGRGWIQLTGRANYYRCSKDLGIDLIGQPDLAEEHPWQVSGWFWKTSKLSERAEKFSVEQVTRVVNGGVTHLEERVNRTKKAFDALGLEFKG